MEKRLDLFLIKHPLIYFILPLIYYVFVQISMAECKGYWDLPYEHSPELEEQIAEYNKQVQAQEIVVIEIKQQYLKFKKESDDLQALFEKTRLMVKPEKDIVTPNPPYLADIVQETIKYINDTKQPFTLNEAKYIVYQIIQQHPDSFQWIPDSIDKLSNPENEFYWLTNLCQLQNNNPENFATIRNIYRWIDVSLLLNSFAKIQHLPEKVIHPYLFLEHQYLLLENLFLNLKHKPSLEEYLGTENDVYSGQRHLDILYEYTPL